MLRIDSSSPALPTSGVKSYSPRSMPVVSFLIPALNAKKIHVEIDASQRLRLIVVAGDVLEGELRGERRRSATFAIPIGIAVSGGRRAAGGSSRAYEA